MEKYKTNKSGMTNHSIKVPGVSTKRGVGQANYASAGVRAKETGIDALDRKRGKRK